MKSPIICSVRHHTSDTLSCVTLSVINEYQIFMCLVHYLLKAFPFFYRRIDLMLSLKKNAVQDSLYLSLKKILCSTDRRHEVISAHQFSLYRAVGVEFFFVELTMGNPCPKDNPPPEYPRMLVWTENDASTHYFKIPLPLVLIISGRVRVPLIYLIMCTILSQFSKFGACTLVIRNKTSVQVSGLDRLVENNVFATML